MTRLISSTLLLGLLAAPVTAAEPTIEELKRQNEDLKKQIEDLKKQVDEVKKISAELKTIKDALGKLDEIRGKSVAIETYVELIEKDLKEMRRKTGTESSSPSTSLKPDATTTLKGMGRVRFINAYAEEMSVVVNGRSYRLMPGDEKVVPVPPGEFTYQVLQLQSNPQDRLIAADETKTFRIYPIK